MSDIVERLNRAATEPQNVSDSDVINGKLNTKLLLDAIAEIERLRSLVEWRPIDTAPKDGTEILVASNAYEGGRLIAKWFHYNGTGAFRDWDHDPHTPTHWIPLLPPPEQKP